MHYNPDTLEIITNHGVIQISFIEPDIVLPIIWSTVNALGLENVTIRHLGFQQFGGYSMLHGHKSL